MDTTADEAVNKTTKKPGRGVVASEWLIERFRECLSWESEQLFRRGKEEGISRNAIFEAKNLLDLPKPRKQTAQDGSTSWTWWVPPNWPPLSPSRNGGTVGTVEDNPFPD